MAKKRKKKSPLKKSGDLVCATTAARVLGLDPRTVRGRVERGVWSGVVVEEEGRSQFYLHRSTFEALCDPGEALMG